MATAKSIAYSHAAFKQPNPLDEFVAPRERIEVPNHLLDTKLFNKISQNSTTKVEPSVVNFAGFNINKTHKRRIKICNSSAERQNLHIVPPASRHFSIKYTKPKRFVPGFTIDIVITFVPDEWRYYYDCLRLHCKGEENLVVPIHAFPVMDSSKFPRKLVFTDKNIALGESYTQTLPLYSHSPVDFEFQINILQSHPSFHVHPLSGVVPGQGKTHILVVYKPMEYVTSHMSMQLTVSQFNTQPLLCDVTASCQPPSASQLTKSVKDFDELYKQTKLLDPRVISPVQIARRRQKTGLPKSTTTEPSGNFERGGYQFPHRVNTQHAVNKVLLQEKGKLKMKELRDVILDKGNASSNSKSMQVLLSVDSSPQMKEAAFEMMVRQDVVEERANQLRWQVRLGDQPMSDEARTTILKHREVAAHKYRFTVRKDPDSDQEIRRLVTKRGGDRSWRRANQIAIHTPTFDPFKNNPWTNRHRATDRFQQAARTILIRCRAQKKVLMMRNMIEDYQKAQTSNFTSSSRTATPFQVSIRELGAATTQVKDADLQATFTPDSVRPFTFPVYVSPDTKEDIAPDALGDVPLKVTEVSPIRNVPFHDLVVPKYYQITGYNPHDVGETLKGYVPPHLARPLRSGAEDEVIKVTLPSHVNQSESPDRDVIDSEEEQRLAEDDVDVGSGASDQEVGVFPDDKMSSSTELIPPPGLFKNPNFHKLQIFSRAPGLILHRLPISHGETDYDSFLCPMPNKTRLPGANKYLDRKDVIKGVMGWKKFSSHGLGALSHTPTLMDAWLPRWSDAFSHGMIPTQLPGILHSLPSDDAPNVMVDDEEEEEDSKRAAQFPLLTVDMIKSNFATEEELLRDRERTPSDESFKESVPQNTNLLTDLPGNSSKDQRQEALERLVLSKYDRLGLQVRERLYAMESDYERQ